jgi:transposase
MKQNNHTVENKVHLIKIAIDMHLKSFRVVRQMDHALVQPAQRFEAPRFYQWLEKEKEKAERVAVCYEAGCFGYEPARRMQGMGVEVYVIAPQSWDEQRKRQTNDKWDAAVMCRRLSEYLDGHLKALSVVHIPSRQEEERRAVGRFREQLCKEIRRMQAMGRSLLLQREMAVRGRWWRGATWEAITQGMPSWVIHQLQTWKELIEQLEKGVSQEEKQLRSTGAAEPVLFGEGELTHALLKRELINIERFKNARQVGNYYGLCPSESSSGPSRRLGPITKHGNPRLRRLMVELAWRIVRFQPQYVALRRWRPVLLEGKTGAAARKKAIVAVARRLAVDLWRIGIGRKTAQELGLRLQSRLNSTAKQTKA